MVSDNYYESRKPKMLEDFDKTANLIRESVASSYGVDFADALYRDGRQEYEVLIPQIPHVEERRGAALNSFLLITAQEVALYKAMKKQGKTASEAWEICHEALKMRVQMVPKIKRWFLKRMMYSGILRRRLQKFTNMGKPLGFGNFEIRYVAGDGNDFDFGIDYVKCGNYNFAQEHGAEEFAAYVCMSDIALSNAMGWGLIRTETLADGCARCDFRFKKGGQTRISSKTPEVQATIEKIAKKEFSNKDRK
ncbi:L-2-amino-thiazoline-4-carboxylic acid hydrolase [Chloroflexota bacterium]